MNRRRSVGDTNQQVETQRSSSALQLRRSTINLLPHATHEIRIIHARHASLAARYVRRNSSRAEHGTSVAGEAALRPRLQSRALPWEVV